MRSNGKAQAKKGKKKGQNCSDGWFENKNYHINVESCCGDTNLRG